MAQSFVRVPVDGLGKLIDAWTLTTTGQYRQAVILGDPAVDANVISISTRLHLPVELTKIVDYDTVGTDNVDVVGLVLPSATGAQIAGIVSNPLFVRLSDGAAAIATLPVSAASLPLPSGASTEVTLASILAQLDVALSTRALETGGNLATLAGTVSAARAAVNLIVGQAGIAAGSGINGVTVPRVTVATDDAINAILGITSGAKVITDANGTLQQYLRGLIYLLITAGAKSISYEKIYQGSAQTVINTATDIAAGNFSGAPAASYDNTNDALIPDAEYALAMLEAPDWAAAPVAGTTVDLYGIVLNVDGTDDETDAPSGTSAGGAHYFGSFLIAAADSLQRRQILINVMGMKQIDFYIKNSTAQNMNNDGGTNCVVKITPVSRGYTG